MDAVAPQTNYRLGYRPDVEGLRAVAILLVVAAHAKVELLAGGYVGVDVFYVLSGYLITGLLVQEATTRGRIGFAVFYGRRLRRLLPALLLMLVVTCGLAWLLMPPSELMEQAAAASSAALWLSNFHFATWNVGYFAPAATTSLFVHTWSLGVEEQFYLVWPLLVMLATGAFRHSPFALGTARLKWLFGSIFAGSFALCLVLTWRAPQFAFYMMPTRAWQFALGALVFLAVGSPALRPATGFARMSWLRHVGWVGLAMILFTAIWIDSYVPYPGTWALLPTFGAALVLAGGGHAATRGVGRVLSWRPIQALGKVSYAWYLWHWPILLLGATVVDVDSPWNRLLLVLLSLGIAAVSYHFFETPIRHQRRLLVRPRLAVAAALCVMVTSAALARHRQRVAPAQATGAAFARLASARKDVPLPEKLGCHEGPGISYSKTCAFGDPRAPHVAVLMGDSIAESWFPAMQRVLDRPGWRFLSITKDACPMVDQTYFSRVWRRYYTECTAWRQDALRQLAHLHPDLVVISSYAEGYPFTDAQWRQGAAKILQALSKSAGHVYVIRSAPTLPFEAPACLEPRGKLYRDLVGTSHCTAPAGPLVDDKIYAALGAAASSFDNVRVLDLTDAICPMEICRAEYKGMVVFMDSHHMTATFAATLAPELARSIGLGWRPTTPTVSKRAASAGAGNVVLTCSDLPTCLPASHEVAGQNDNQ
jgi:peptidoglycan/LPS O-acetylase OafA/YrhL